jgi:CheY-like chemotaxis protein
MALDANVQESSLRVMVVDDHVASGDLLREILTMEGYAVRVAICGRDAVAMSREFKPQIALLDIGLPDIDGFALAKQLKAELQLPPIRLIALSGYSRPADTIGEQGFDHYLVKPVDVDQLLSLLQRLG